MTLLHPGHDPVADHVWCCEHPEPWHYFRPVAYQRLLSAIERVYRVDPVEASWCLGILEWTATPEAIPLLNRILVDRAVSPKQQRKIRQILQNLEDGSALPENAFSHADLQKKNIPDLLKLLQQTQDLSPRKKAIELLIDAYANPDNKIYAVDILSEVLSEQHPAAAKLVSAAISAGGSNSLSPDDRAQLFLACATWIHPAALDTLYLILDSGQGGVPIYEL